MKVEGKKCPYCHSILKDADKCVACSACGIAHHEECWNENQGCTTYGCQGKALDSKLAPEPDLKVKSNTDIKCSKCGSLSSSYSKFCHACGANLSESPPDINSSTINTQSPFQVVTNASNQNSSNYQSNSSVNFEGSRNSYTSSTYRSISQMELYSAYFKKNRDYYINDFSSVSKGNHKFNGAAFIPNATWFAYRKMIPQALAIFVVHNLIIGILGENIWGILVVLAVNVFLGKNANQWYKSYVDKKIDNLYSSGKSDQEVLNSLNHMRDSSFWSVILYISIYSIGTAIIFSILESSI